MSTKQQPPDGMTYDENSHQWVPAEAAPATVPAPAPSAPAAATKTAPKE